MTRRLQRLVAMLAGAALLASGCSFSVEEMPLPGGTEVGDDPVQVTVMFRNVLDLVPQSTVKVNDVDVGMVRDVKLRGQKAAVTLELRRGTDLPDNARAKIRQTSLLGAKFVSLEPPSQGASSDQLQDGDVIPLERTERNPEVEEVLGALSLLLNGGGVAQLHTITEELSNVMTGNEQEIKAFLTNMNEMVSSLDANRQAITTALDELNRLARRLADREEQINTALTELSPGLRSLSEQSSQLVGMLQALDDLGTVAVDTIRQSKENVVADLKALAPILQRLVQAGSDLPKALEILPTFPFTDAVLDAVKGDYMNAFVEVHPKDDYEAPIPPLTPPDDMPGGSNQPSESEEPAGGAP